MAISHVSFTVCSFCAPAQSGLHQIAPGCTTAQTFETCDAWRQAEFLSRSAACCASRAIRNPVDKDLMQSHAVDKKKQELWTGVGMEGEFLIFVRISMSWIPWNADANSSNAAMLQYLRRR